ncbi:putative vacuolar aspartyl aminopeptidase Lap4 [Tirmania nivea]|nr:putative vacuolar aspartyl aminopeptidase Lap4 [Tirmania nivea]
MTKNYGTPSASMATSRPSPGGASTGKLVEMVNLPTVDDTPAIESEASAQVESTDSDIWRIVRAAASSDRQFRTLLRAVSSRSAGPAELREFKRHVDALKLAARTPEGQQRKCRHASEYTLPFLNFINENPTVFHAVEYFESKLHKAGYIKLNERENWATGKVKLECGGKYFVSRNGSSLIAFVVGEKYKVGDNGVGMIVGHIDALTARVKPVSKKASVQGYTMLGVAPYAGALNNTWFDRDLGIGGKVIVKQSDGKVASRLVKLGWPIARIPTLAPHFGQPSNGPFNKETQMVPVIGIECSLEEQQALEEHMKAHGANSGTFAATQPPKLVQLIATELGISEYSTILNWELELFDTQPGVTGGMSKEFIFAPRIDDKLCSWAAVEGLVEATDLAAKGGSIALVGLFDDEEIGSRLRQGAAGNFLPGVVERIVDTFAQNGQGRSNLLSQTYANSFLLSADVTHAVNPNFVSAYLTDHMPKLNVGITIAADSNGHMTTDSISTAFLSEVAKKCGSELQVFQIRNDSRSGGTVGPMLSSVMGVRAIDAGLPQLSMHSIRATTGALDPGLGTKLFRGFLELWEEVDVEFRE